MNQHEIAVYKNGTMITFTYEEILEHHGGEMPGGVALAFRMLQWVFDDILKTIPEHGKCTFYSGLGRNGRGIMDTVKQVLGVVEDESLRLDIEYSLDKMGPAAPGGGRYYFEVGCGDTLVKLAVKDGVIPEEFFRYSAEMHRKRLAGEKITEEEIAYLQKLREGISRVILEADSEDLFRVI